MFSSAFSLKKQQGSALLFTFFVVILLVSLVGALLFPTLVRSSATQFDIHRFHALNIAEAGLSNVLYNVQNGGTGALGTKGAPLPYHHGSYYTLITLGKPSPLLNEIIVMSRFQQASCKITAITDYPIPQKAEEKPPAEGILFSPPVPLLSKGKIIIGGNTGVTKGQSVKGSIHSNDSITIQGNIKIEGDIHSSKKIEISGRPQILGEVQEDVEPLDLPKIQVEDFKDSLEYILGKDGSVTDLQGNLLATDTFQNWKFIPSGGPGGLPTWTYSGSTSGLAGAYFVEGNALINKTDGSNWNLTVVAQGNIQYMGNSTLTPYHINKIGLIAGTDLIISGSATLNLGFYAAKEQVRIVGTPQIEGALYAEDIFPSTDPSVLFTSIAGTPNITLGSGVSIPFPASEQFVEILSSQILYSQEE